MEKIKKIFLNEENTFGMQDNLIDILMDIIFELNEIADRLNQSVSKPVDNIFNDNTRSVCKYCGGSNVAAVSDRLTHYYYCNDCDSTTDLIGIRDFNNNDTEKWERIHREDWKSILIRYFADLEDGTKVKQGAKMKDLIEFIEELTNEIESVDNGVDKHIPVKHISKRNVSDGKETCEPLERIPEETKIDKTSTREVYDKFHNEYTYIVDYASILMDKHFPKGESKERSKALVFNGELIHYMMLVMNGVVEGLTDKKKGVDKGVDTKSQSGEREEKLKELLKEYYQSIIDTEYAPDEPEQNAGYGLQDDAKQEILKLFRDMLSESKKECIEVEKKKAILELSEEITKEVETIQEEYGDDIEVVHSMIDDLIVEKLGGELKEIYDGGWGWYA